MPPKILGNNITINQIKKKSINVKIYAKNYLKRKTTMHLNTVKGKIHAVTSPLFQPLPSVLLGIGGEKNVGRNFNNFMLRTPGASLDCSASWSPGIHGSLAFTLRKRYEREDTHILNDVPERLTPQKQLTVDRYRDLFNSNHHTILQFSAFIPNKSASLIPLYPQLNASLVFTTSRVTVQNNPPENQYPPSKNYENFPGLVQFVYGSSPRRIARIIRENHDILYSHGNTQNEILYNFHKMPESSLIIKPFIRDCLRTLYFTQDINSTQLLLLSWYLTPDSKVSFYRPY